MVSIKSLAVLLFAAAITAAPLAGEKDSHDSVAVSKNTCKVGQKIHCCDDDGSSANAGLVSLLNNPQIKCNNLGVNVLAVPTLTDNSRCKGTIICCPGDNSQTGLVNANVDLKCTAPGLN
ncbi:hypothetical protein B9Z19DRAFT_1107039 [Tuber borchii]|uniref:Hydrophobin n=1 Tax=Tuber borchii TaxID=42251 RepID=A0A2T6ZY96_TUBBO|nr:hypothetical protein B9Z19DRAFT_1107039 [Tuber borchii]